jgi:hypothetical protein
MSDEPRSPPEATDAELAELMTQFIGAALDPRHAADPHRIAAEIEAASPGAMQRLANSLDARKVRLGRVTLQ